MIPELLVIRGIVVAAGLGWVRGHTLWRAARVPAVRTPGCDIGRALRARAHGAQRYVRAVRGISASAIAPTISALATSVVTPSGSPEIAAPISTASTGLTYA